MNIRKVLERVVILVSTIPEYTDTSSPPPQFNLFNTKGGNDNFGLKKTTWGEFGPPPPSLTYVSQSLQGIIYTVAAALNQTLTTYFILAVQVPSP